jgi:hypothetical protein
VGFSVFVPEAYARTNAGFTRTNELSPHKCRVDAHERPFGARFGGVNTQLCAYSWPHTPNTGHSVKRPIVRSGNYGYSSDATISGASPAFEPAVFIPHAPVVTCGMPAMQRRSTELRPAS